MKCIYKQCYLTKVCVAFGNAFQIFQAVFFPLPANVQTVSQPIAAYQNSNFLDNFLPSKQLHMYGLQDICDFDQLQFLSTAHQDLTKKNDIMQL